eukprot:TRINITY_DN47184_c0_g1_i1.p1 TRINITY_DN47184_c0_g1~~TRINITY_DN47184_c0_g1_i1.p1  ORF type:complete len:291 (+),score=75.37 TRINITY_DN47184_c0_g1_i1:75-875(+)
MAAARSLFRSYLRIARELERSGNRLPVCHPVESGPVQWINQPPGGCQFRYITRQGLAAERAALVASCPGQTAAAIPGEELLAGITPERLRERLRAGFRAPLSQPPAAVLSDGFATLRLMRTLARLAVCSSRSELDGVTVEFMACPFPGRTRGEWLFQYRVCLVNGGEKKVHFRGRRWTIWDANGKVHARVPSQQRGTAEEFESALVGQEPQLGPGDAFEYCSGTTLPTPAGSIEGALWAEVSAQGGGTKKGEIFPVPLCPLLRPAS